MDQSAQPSAPEVAPQVIRQPNLFELRGQDVSVSYSTSSISGQPLFQYKDSNREVNRSGDEIRRVETEIGTLVTITLVMTIDTGSTDFSVLIPRIRLPSSNEARVATVGITTVNRLSFLPGPTQLQVYSTVRLNGTARFVFF